MTHIDEWLDQAHYVQDPGERYARLFLEVARMPAWKYHLYQSQLAPLYCTHDGLLWRVTGASRLGEVWLQADLSQERGYTRRVSVDACSGWVKGTLP